ncbi:acetyltransferase [Azospirillum sp. TSH100]|uniref:GNAT family N-acetyltransferase n=1 Tax=Azospirillum sp. TSH100 TaxID=652764 RepID=UPI000D60BC1B|nr:GNAT family N-acetyltransferase [Azospirillum sp. TSH100]PWC87736.1 acetyltransferase [Azospirillum sp. TSH100]QCG88206.1 GNAT family N-acetyltransferase [Azospirillum sp. TSH100]
MATARRRADIYGTPTNDRSGSEAAEGGYGENGDCATLALPLTVRQARQEDLTTLEWYGLHTPHREIIAGAFRLQERGDGAMLLADANGFPVGQICIDFLRKRPSGRATLWALRVFQPFRGLGIGARLLRAAERVVIQRGVPYAELGVDRDNAGVLPFYERLGYQHCGRERGQFLYHTPEGRLVRVAIDQWLLHKRLSKDNDATGTASNTTSRMNLATD